MLFEMQEKIQKKSKEICEIGWNSCVLVSVWIQIEIISKNSKKTCLIDRKLWKTLNVVTLYSRLLVVQSCHLTKSVRITCLTFGL